MSALVPSPSIDLRPLSTSELIDRGFSLYRQNFAGLLLLAFLSQGVMLLFQVAVARMHLTPSTQDFVSGSARAIRKIEIFSGMAALALVATFFFGLVMTAYVSDAYLNAGPSVKKSLRQMATRAGGAAWTCILRNFFILLAGLFFVLAALAISAFNTHFPPASFFGLILSLLLSLVLLVASLVPILVVFMRLMCAAPAFALENLTGGKACRRSSELVRYDPGLGFFYWGETRLSLLLLPLFVIDVLASTLTGIPMLVSQVNEFMRHGSAYSFGSESDAVVVGSQVLTYAVAATIQPLYVLAVTLFYYDVRIRREGFDLEFLSSRLEKST